MVNNSQTQEAVLQGFQLSTDIHIAFLTAIFAFGIIGNMFVIIIYSRKHNFTSFNIYIISLAVSDLIVCLTLPVQMPLMFWYKTQQLNGTTIYLKAFNLTSWLTALVNGSHLLSIAIDRKRAVFKNTVYKQSKKDVFMKILAIFIICAAISSVVFMTQLGFERGVMKMIFIVLISIGSAAFLIIVIVCYSMILYKLATAERRIYPFASERSQDLYKRDINVIEIESNNVHKNIMNKR